MQTQVVKNNKPEIAIRSKKYAENAYPLVADVKGTDNEAKYRTLALTFPTMIMQSGLAQAVGFLMAKDEPHHRKLLSHLKVLLNKDNLHDEILGADIIKYQKLTRNAIEASSWLKRYTQALLKNKGAES